MTLTKLLTNFIQENCDKEITVRKNKEFSYNFEKSRVYYVPINDEFSPFINHIRYAHRHTPLVSEFLYSVLHEVGHNMTEADADVEQLDFDFYDYFVRMMESCGDIYSQFVERNKVCLPSDAYFNLKIEWIATEWAIEFVKNNLKICKELDEKIKKFL